MRDYCFQILRFVSGLLSFQQDYKKNPGPLTLSDTERPWTLERVHDSLELNQDPLAK